MAQMKSSKEVKVVKKTAVQSQRKVAKDSRGFQADHAAGGWKECHPRLQCGPVGR
ncbi:MAG: hypothetical protein HJJLKODD_01206 [Phycisphaerae bacterium]|nr:hypothetical protein [Phycisphaerae bacterium]